MKRNLLEEVIWVDFEGIWFRFVDWISLNIMAVLLKDKLVVLKL